MYSTEYYTQLIRYKVQCTDSKVQVTHTSQLPNNPPMHHAHSSHGFGSRLTFLLYPGTFPPEWSSGLLVDPGPRSNKLQ